MTKVHEFTGPLELTDWGRHMQHFEAKSKAAMVETLLCFADISRRELGNRTKAQLSATYARLTSSLFDDDGKQLPVS